MQKAMAAIVAAVMAAGGASAAVPAADRSPVASDPGTPQVSGTPEAYQVARSLTKGGKK